MSLHARANRETTIALLEGEITECHNDAYRLREMARHSVFDPARKEFAREAEFRDREANEFAAQLARLKAEEAS